MNVKKLLVLLLFSIIYSGCHAQQVKPRGPCDRACSSVFWSCMDRDEIRDCNAEKYLCLELCSR